MFETVQERDGSLLRSHFEQVTVFFFLQKSIVHIYLYATGILLLISEAN